MPSGCADLQSCVALMAGGDTLIIQDGVYTGVENAIRQNSYPPSGSPEAYTIIKAENDGLVLFDGQGTTAMFNLNGAGPYS